MYVHCFAHTIICTLNSVQDGYPHVKIVISCSNPNACARSPRDYFLGMLICKNAHTAHPMCFANEDKYHQSSSGRRLPPFVS